MVGFFFISHKNYPIFFFVFFFGSAVIYFDCSLVDWEFQHLSLSSLAIVAWCTYQKNLEIIILLI